MNTCPEDFYPVDSHDRMVALHHSDARYAVRPHHNPWRTPHTFVRRDNTQITQEILEP